MDENPDGAYKVIDYIQDDAMKSRTLRGFPDFVIPTSVADSAGIPHHHVVVEC